MLAPARKYTRTTFGFIVAGFIGLSKSALADAGPVSSTFDQGAEGWTTISADSNPEALNWMVESEDGFVRFTESRRDATNSFFAAPSAFLGAQSHALGGTLRLRIRQLNTTRLNRPSLVVLRSGALELHSRNREAPLTTWTDYDILLKETEWTKDSVNGPGATPQDFLTALSNLDALLIRAEFSDEPDERTDLDYVELIFPPSASGPRLSIRLFPENVVEVSWATPARTVVLEAKAEVIGQEWIAIAADQISNDVDDFSRVIVATAGGASFFRLRE
jgi:hypothetical protein